MGPMRLAALLCGLLCIVRADDPTTSLPGVHDLTPETFDSVVNGKVHALVEFYAPWCGHCKSLTPEFKKLGEAVAADAKLKGRVVIAKVDADSHRELGSRFEVRGFPTLKWFSRGKPVDSPEDYQGGRKLEAFLKFIEDKMAEDKSFGRVEALDAIVTGFLTGDKDAAMKEIEAKIQDLTGEERENGGIYLKLMQKVKEKGEGYLETERARVTRMIDSGNVNQEKIVELSRKVSIISAFIPET